MSRTPVSARARDSTPEKIQSESHEGRETTVFAASEARANFMEVIGRVRYGRERLVITNKGKPAAALVTIEDLKLLQLLDDKDIQEKLHVRISQEEDSLDFEEYARRRLGSPAR